MREETNEEKADRVARELLDEVMTGFYEFMREAESAKEIRRKNMEEVCKAVFSAGFVCGVTRMHKKGD